MIICIVVRSPEAGVDARTHTYWGDPGGAASFVTEVSARYQVAPAVVAPDLVGLYEAVPAVTGGGATLRLFAIAGRPAAAEATFRVAAGAWAEAAERTDSERLPADIKDGLTDEREKAAR